jgi:hypothetical protein
LREEVVPPEGPGLVAEAHPGEIVAENIAAKIARQKNTVPVVNPVVYFGIEIVEIEDIIADILVFGEGQKKINIGSAACHQE